MSDGGILPNARAVRCPRDIADEQAAAWVDGQADAWRRAKSPTLSECDRSMISRAVRAIGDGLRNGFHRGDAP